MSLPYTQNFDGVPGSSLPGGFNQTGGTWSVTGTDNSITPTSSPNMLRIATSSTTKAYLTYGTADGNGGDLTLKVNLNDFSSTRQGYVGLTARGSAPTLDGTTSQYEVLLNWDIGSLSLIRVNSGSATTLATVSMVGGWDQWDTLTWTLAGSSHSVKLQRSSDNEWLTTGGSWQVSQTDAIGHTDSSPLTGSGYFGFVSKAGASSSHDGYWDDFSATAPGTAIALTEGHDTPSISGHFQSSGSVAKVEGHDAAAISGTCTVGTLAKAEAHDTPSMSAGGSTGSMAAAEQHDTPTLIGSTPNAIFTAQEGADLASIPATFTSVGTLTPHEGHDVPGFVAVMRRGTIAATERHDTPSIAGHFGTSGAMAATEGRDTPAFVGHVTHATLAIAEAGDRAAIPAIAAGVPPYFKVMEQGDVALILGGLPTVRYHVYANTGAGDPINYVTPVATVDNSPWTSGVLATPGTWSFGVRAFNGYGEEQNLDCAVTIVLDADGHDVTNRPAPPVGLRAFAVAGTPGTATTSSDLTLESGSYLLLESGDRLATEAGSGTTPATGNIRVLWSYPPTKGGRAPAGFHIYAGTGGTPDYTTPVATVTYNSAILGILSTTLGGLTDGVTYSIGVRSFNATGEEANTVSVNVTADASGPLPVTGLIATTTV